MALAYFSDIRFASDPTGSVPFTVIRFGRDSIGALLQIYFQKTSAAAVIEDSSELAVGVRTQDLRKVYNLSLIHI